MKLEIDTNQMSRIDEDMVIELANRISKNRATEQVRPEAQNKKAEEKVERKSEKKTEEQNQEEKGEFREGKFYFPAKRGEVEYAIKVVIDKLNGADVKTIKERAQISEGAVYATLSKLHKNNEIEKSNTRPVIYYLKGENAELKQQLKHARGKKFSNF